MNKDSANVIAFGGNTMVYESIRRLALKELHGLLQNLMDNIDDALFDLSEKVGNDRERTMYFDAMRLVRIKRKAIEQGFDEAMQGAFDHLVMNRPGSTEKPGLDELELSLVDDEVLEDQIAIDNMISKARPRYEDDLFALRERLREVLHRSDIDPDDNPFDPRALCEGFHQACALLDTEIEVKLVLYKLFDKLVMGNLGPFYDRMNDDFASKGILPDMHASRERINHSVNRVKRHSTNPQVPDHAVLPDEKPDEQPGGDNLLAMMQQALHPGAADAPMVTAGLQPSGAPGVGVGVLPPAVLSALRGLQTAPGMEMPVSLVEPGQMKTQLQQQISVFREQNRHQVSAADDQIIDIVSMLFDFFFEDRALPDPIKVLIGRLQIPILKVAILDKGFFNSKKHPARKLLDSISRASLGWSQEAGEEQVLIDEIERIVGFLINEFDQDIAVFEQALSEFEEFLNTEKQRVVGRLEQIERIEQEREQRLENAREASDQLISKLIEGVDLSPDLRDFLVNTWNRALIYTWMSKGPDSNHWKNLRRISGTLIWTLIPKDNEKDRKKLLGTLPPLLRALNQAMDLIQAPKDERDRVFQILMREHSRVVKQTSRDIIERRKTAPEEEIRSWTGSVDIRLEEDASGEVDFVQTEEDELDAISGEQIKVVIQNLEDFATCVEKGEIEVSEEIVIASEPQPGIGQPAEGVEEEYLKQARNLEVGDWVEFLQESGRWQHARLSWKSNLTGKLVFVNRHGRKLRDTKVQRLAAEFASGKARPLQSVSVFDRAIHSIMSGLKPQALA